MQRSSRVAYLKRLNLDNWILKAPAIHVVCYDDTLSLKAQQFLESYLKSSGLSFEFVMHQTMSIEALYRLGYGEKTLIFLIDCPLEVKSHLPLQVIESNYCQLEQRFFMLLSSDNLLKAKSKKMLLACRCKIAAFFDAPWSPG